jgi:phospholipid/cholesterol/gamma-HCH transport system ATP-binding protein
MNAMESPDTPALPVDPALAGRSCAPAGDELRDAIVSIEGLVYRAGRRTICDGLDLAFRKGQVTAVMGPSGTGKTTLLKLITGQIRPDRGRVLVEGQDLALLSRSGIYAVRRRMGMLFQNGALLTDLSVFENVAFPLREHTDLPERLVRHVVLTKLHAVGLRGAATLMPAELSGGMARRVALALSLIHI